MKKSKAIIQAFWEDITYNRVIFVSLIMLIAVSNMVVFLTESTLSGFDQSIRNVRNQLGADIIIVSQEYDSNVKDALFSGTPSSFSFQKDALIGIDEIDGIETYTSNLFVSSLDSSCCEEQVEFVIYDEQTDFIINSFIENYESKINKRDIVIGSDINYQVGDEVTFFGCIFHVAAKLKRTGMGYDQCIFANQNCGDSISTFLEMESFHDKSSMLLIKKEAGYDIDILCEEINAKIADKRLVAYKTLNLYTDVENSVQSIKNIAISYIVFLLILGIVAIFVITVMNVEAKSKYSMILLILGVKKTKTCKILVLENILISFIATFLGNILGILFLLLFKTYISVALELPLSMGVDVIRYMIINLISSFILMTITTLAAYKVALPELEHYKRKLT